MYTSFEHTVAEPAAQETNNPKTNKKYDYSPDIFGAVADQPIVEIFIKIFHFVDAFVFHKITKAKVKNYYLP
jgi:hypothetical protein